MMKRLLGTIVVNGAVLWVERKTLKIGTKLFQVVMRQKECRQTLILVQITCR